MADLDRNEIKRVHVNYGHGRGLVRLVHLPTGISVEAPSTGESVHRINLRLMKELEERVSQVGDIDKP